MPPSKMSNNSSFYQLACYTTDTFTSCIMIYEDLLPHFEAEISGDGIKERLLNIGDMLTTLYTELTTLKNDITTSFAATVVGSDKVSESTVESNSVTQVICEHNKQENVILEASTVEQDGCNKEKVLDKLPKRSWEDVRQIQAEKHQKEEVNHEDKKIDQTISHEEKVHRKPTENLRKQESDFVYKCGNCQEAITVYNQDLDLSIALHNQDGCCRGKPSKLLAVQKGKQGEKLNVASAQGQVQNTTTFQEATTRLDPTPSQTNKLGATHLRCIQQSGNAFICTVCNKMLSGPKTFIEHLTGNYHQYCLKELSEETQEKTDYGKKVTRSQLITNCENNSPTSVQQKESVSSLDAHLFSIIKHLSRSLPTQMQYLSVVKSVIMCNLCGCQIPPTVTNVRDHVLGSRHSKNQTELQSANKNCSSNE